MTTELSDTIIHAMTELAAQNDDIEVMWLYGSRAQQTAHSESDYDMAIAFKNFQLSDFDRYLRPNELAIEWADLLELNSDKLSIIDINQVPIYLAYNVVEYGTILYQQKSPRAYHEQNRIYSMYEYQMREVRNEK